MMGVFWVDLGNMQLLCKHDFLKTLIIFLFLLSTKLTHGSQCNQEALICIDLQNFQQCANINGDYTLTGLPTSCPCGQLCDDSSGSAQCTTQPSCTAAGNIPAPACNQYYQCIAVMWWWDSQLTTCPDNQLFDIGLEECAPASSVDCQYRTTSPTSTNCTASTTTPSTTITTTSTTISKTTRTSTSSTRTSTTSSTSTSTPTSTSTSTTTNTPTSTTTSSQPSCTAAGTYPAPACNQYYQCIPVMWWWEGLLTTCPDNQLFDIGLEECAPACTVNCQYRTTGPTSTNCTASTTTPSTTTAAYSTTISKSTPTSTSSTTSSTTTNTPTSSTTPSTTAITTPTKRTTTSNSRTPSCSSPGKQPASSCYQYYECEQIWWSLQLNLKNCLDGYAFDTIQLRCRPAQFVNCQSRITTTVKPTTSQKPPLPPIGPHKCSGPGRYPAQNCYRYYECVQVEGNWTTKLRDCKLGYAFELSLKTCRPAIYVDCGSRVPIRPPLRPPSVPPEDVLPKCYGPGRYPALSCHQYYECVRVYWGWEPVLTNCSQGDAFDIGSRQCKHWHDVDCGHRQSSPPIPPKCSGPGKHPGPRCDQYYQCISVWDWSWEPRLKSCPPGQVFDADHQKCINSTEAACGQRPNFPRPPPTVTPKCSGPGNHPSPNCYYYYDCISVQWGWEPYLKPCPDDQAFDIKNNQCIPSSLVDCQGRIRTKPPKKPVCPSQNLYPGPSCYQYYKCEQNWWRWEAKLKTCPQGEAFDVSDQRCTHRALINCANTGWPPVGGPPAGGPSVGGGGPPVGGPPVEGPPVGGPPVGGPPVGGPPVGGPPVGGPLVGRPPVAGPAVGGPPVGGPPAGKPPICSGFGKHPSWNCRQYYECVPIKWWWEPSLQTCPEGQAFDEDSKDCTRSALASCLNPIIPGRPPAERPQAGGPPAGGFPPNWQQVGVPPAGWPPSVPPQGVLPKCYGPRRYPALNCHQYYECVRLYWGWEPLLTNCSQGDAFDISSRQCKHWHDVDCGHRQSSPPIPPKCSGPGKHPGPRCDQYYECISVLDWSWEPRLKSCPPGQAFDADHQKCINSTEAACGQRPNLPRPPPTVTPTCSAPGKYQASKCNEYYECEAGRWSYQPTLKTCPQYQAFEPNLQICTHSALIRCRKPDLPLSKPNNTVPVKCSGPGNHPSPNCYYYYDCISVQWGWEPYLKPCPDDQAFDLKNNQCIPSSLVDCQGRIRTKPPKKPVCPSQNLYPGPSCYQYYKCELNWWRWEAKLKTCPQGEAFDVSDQNCSHRALINCANSGTPPPGWPPVGRPPAEGSSPGRPPTCFGPGKYPTPNRSQYYQCVSVGWWWEWIIKSCPRGQEFDKYRRTCTRSPIIVNPPGPLPSITEPTCSGPDRHPSPRCYQYYECVPERWWWEPKLKTCPKGHSFDIFRKSCIPSTLVDCQKRPTWVQPPRAPKCYKPGKYEGPRCYQYYECSPDWWEAELKTCPEGQGYYPKKHKCVSAELIGCKLPTKQPKCQGPGRYSADKCYQYYECEKSWWWWTPKLKACPPGQAYTSSLKRCVRSHFCRYLGDSGSNESSEQSSKENGSNENSAPQSSNEDD